MFFYRFILITCFTVSGMALGESLPDSPEIQAEVDLSLGREFLYCGQGKMKLYSFIR
jgi:hypothetical protein